MNEFRKYHPLVNFSYFFFAVLFTCAHINPISIAIAFVAAFSSCGVLKGRKALYKNAVFMPVLFIAMALINPAFNHQGVTIITYLPSGNPLTAESVYFGLIAAGMVLSVMMFFSCFNEVMTSDKIIYICGRLIPSLSLIFSMVLRAVPKFREQAVTVANSRRGIGKNSSEGNLFKRLKGGISILSILITWSMENAIERADSMKSRGFGASKRTAFSNYNITKRDKYALFWILLLSAYIIAGSLLKVFDFSCFPYIKMPELTPFSITFYIAELVLFSIPILVEITEQIKWKHIV